MLPFKHYLQSCCWLRTSEISSFSPSHSPSENVIYYQLSYCVQPMSHTHPFCCPISHEESSMEGEGEKPNGFQKM